MSNHVTLVTKQYPERLASPTNFSTSTVYCTRLAQTAKPSTVLTASTAAATLGACAVVPGATNYLKITPFFTASSSPIISIVGWSYAKDANLWIPHAIYGGAITLNGSSTITLNGDALVGMSNSATTGFGDAKVYNVVNLNTYGWFVIDTFGFDQIEILFQSTSSATKANAFISEV